MYERYTDMLQEAKHNNKRIENIERKRQRYTFYPEESTKDRNHYLSQNDDLAGISRKRDGEEAESFSMRMIAVMLILVVAMFLKQTGIFTENAACQTVMAEIGRQLTIEDIEAMMGDDGVHPVEESVQ